MNMMVLVDFQLISGYFPFAYHRYYKYTDKLNAVVMFENLTPI